MNEELRMSAYYYSFEKTGVVEIDKILSAVAHAGKSFHHTDSWQDHSNAADYYSYLEGNTPEEWIQNAANRAANK